MQINDNPILSNTPQFDKGFFLQNLSDDSTLASNEFSITASDPNNHLSITFERPSRSYRSVISPTHGQLKKVNSKTFVSFSGIDRIVVGERFMVLYPSSLSLSRKRTFTLMNSNPRIASIYWHDWSIAEDCVSDFALAEPRLISVGR